MIPAEFGFLVHLTIISCVCCYKVVASTTEKLRPVLFLRILNKCFAFSALVLLVGQQEGHPACKNVECWGAGVVICLERGADLPIAQLMPLPLTVSCINKIEISFIFLVPAYLCSHRQRELLNGCC